MQKSLIFFVKKFGSLQKTYYICIVKIKKIVIIKKNGKNEKDTN